MAKRAAESVLEGLQKRCCEMQARIEGQKDEIAQKKVADAVVAAKAAAEAALLAEAIKKEQAARDNVAKLEQEAREGRAFLLGIDMHPTEWESYDVKYDLINPVLDGTLPVNATSKKDLLTEVLKANAAERIKLNTTLTNLINDDWKRRDRVKRQQVHSISIRVNEKGGVSYRVLYDGSTENNRTTKNKFAYFDIDLYGWVHLRVEKGCYKKACAEFEEEGWFAFYTR